MDCMATALAVQLLRNHSSVGGSNTLAESSMPRYKLRQVQCYIEENLRSDLSLQVIADVAGVSPSHLKSTFRKARSS